MYFFSVLKAHKQFELWPKHNQNTFGLQKDRDL